MTFVLFIAVVMAACASRSPSLLIAGVIYALLQLLHQTVFGATADSDGMIYEISSMSFDLACLLIVVLCSSVLDRDWHLIPLSIIIMLSIANNLYGMSIWLSYGDPSQADRNGGYIYTAVIVLLAGSRFSAGIIMACRNFINRGGSSLRWMPRSIERDS